MTDIDLYKIYINQELGVCWRPEQLSTASAGLPGASKNACKLHGIMESFRLEKIFRAHRVLPLSPVPKCHTHTSVQSPWQLCQGCRNLSTGDFSRCPRPAWEHPWGGRRGDVTRAGTVGVTGGSGNSRAPSLHSREDALCVTEAALPGFPWFLQSGCSPLLQSCLKSRFSCITSCSEPTPAALPSFSPAWNPDFPASLPSVQRSAQSSASCRLINDSVYPTGDFNKVFFLPWKKGSWASPLLCGKAVSASLLSFSSRPSSAVSASFGMLGCNFGCRTEGRAWGLRLEMHPEMHPKLPSAREAARPALPWVGCPWGGRVCSGHAAPLVASAGCDTDLGRGWHSQKTPFFFFPSF